VGEVEAGQIGECMKYNTPIAMHLKDPIRLIALK
jgi:hypothetical protein